MQNQDFQVENFNETTYDKGSAEQPPQQQEPSVFREIMSWVIPIVVAVALVLVLKTYVIINANVPTGSMENTIMTGDNLIGFRLAYKFSDPQRGDVIIFPAPDNPQEKYIKRIIGLPGETVTIEDATVYIDGEVLEEDYLPEEWVVMNDDLEYQVPEGCYFVMGDNRNNSEDARYWTNTYVKGEDIIGKALFIYWPFSDFKGL